MTVAEGTLNVTGVRTSATIAGSVIPVNHQEIVVQDIRFATKIFMVDGAKTDLLLQTVI